MNIEYWDRYDENRQLKPGILIRGRFYPEGNYHLVVHLVIFSSDGRILCQRRAPGKSLELMWDLTVGGSVQMYEKSENAMHRELLEELGLDRDFSFEDVVHTHKGPGYFDDYYFLDEDVDLKDLRLQPEEVCDARWMTLEEIMELQKKDEFTDYIDIPMLYELHRKMKENR